MNQQYHLTMTSKTTHRYVNAADQRTSHLIVDSCSWVASAAGEFPPNAQYKFSFTLQDLDAWEPNLLLSMAEVLTCPRNQMSQTTVKKICNPLQNPF